jgi:RNA polymerase sigma-70 factor (ECF subfamily)
VRKDSTEALLGVAAKGAGREAREKLFALLYDELHACAARLMRRERRDHTLRPTALVHEAYIRLIDQSRVHWNDRAHFSYIAARAMRQILVDHARRRNAQKRGGGATRITLDTGTAGAKDATLEVLAIHAALDALGDLDERAARVVEMRIFAGMTHDEIATVLGVSRRTVDGDWAFARRWLAREIA